MSNTWAVVTAALGSSIFAIVGALIVERLRSARREKFARATELRGACIQLIAGAHRITQRAAALRANMIIRSGFTEALDVVLHLRKPADVLEISDYLFSELGPILDAQALIWLSGDEGLIKSAGDVVLAIPDGINKATALPKDQQHAPSETRIEFLRVQLRGLIALPKDPAAEEALQHSVRVLALASKEFGQVVRKNLGVKDIDAILRAFPGIADDDTGQSEDQGDAKEIESSDVEL